MKYIDLGLPSGTKWADTNEEGIYGYEEAVEKYGNSMPTCEQFEELKDYCQWEWMGDGYSVKGPNGNIIFLPAEGYRFGNESMYFVGSAGYYWSSTFAGSDRAWHISFDFSGVYFYDGRRSNGLSVRLVK